MISLLMVAATLNVMAANVNGQASITLTGVETGKSCKITVAELADGEADIVAVLNTEGRDILFFVDHNGTKYQTFGSTAATMQDLQLGIQTDASTTYTLTASNVKGTKVLKIKINGVTYELTSGLNETITLPANSTLPAAGDEANYVVNPTAPLTPEFCFALEKLSVKGFAGKKLSILKEDRSVLVAEFVLGDNYEFDFSGAAYPANSRYIVLFNGTTAVNADESVMKEYVIDVKPTTTPVVP